jgi:hypothetical protein
MNRVSLSPLVALLAASFGGPLSVGAAQAVTVNITGSTCSWDGNNLNCTATGGGGSPGAPVCSVTPSSSNLPATGGNVVLTANCSPAASTYNWQKNGATMSGGANNAVTDTLGANSGASAVSYTYSVQGCAGSTCGAFASTAVSVAGTTNTGGGGAPDGASLCTAADKAISTTLDWGGGFVTQRLQNGSFPGDATVVAQVTGPAGYSPSLVGSINVAEYGGPPTTRLVTLSTKACDFRIGANYDPTGATAPLAAAAGTTAAIQWSTITRFGVAKLTPGATYYINVKNKNYQTGQLSCAANSSCDAIVQFAMP